MFQPLLSGRPNFFWDTYISKGIATLLSKIEAPWENVNASEALRGFKIGATRVSGYQLSVIWFSAFPDNH
jgi:hypothetical protein